MRTLLSIALSMAVALPVARAQTSTPPAPPGGVGGGGNVPEAIPNAHTLAPVAPENPAPPAPPADLTVVTTPAAPGEPEASVPAAPAELPTGPAVPGEAPNVDASAPAPTTTRPLASPSAFPVWSPEAQLSSRVTPKAKPQVSYRRRSAGAPFALAVGGGFVWNDDSGYRLIGDKRKPQLDAMASYDVLQPGKHLVLSLGASIRHARQQDDGLMLLDNTLQAELMARLVSSGCFWPHARASVGAAWTRVKIDDHGLGGTLDDRDVGLASSFGGGLTLRTPTRALETESGRLASLSLGIMVEAGYTLSQAASFSGVPSGGAPDVERGAVRLGSLSRSGPYLRLMGLVRF